MAKPLVDLPDAERAVIDILEVGFDNISSDFPDEPLTGSATRLQVDLESSNTDGFPVTERAQVRVTAHAASDKRTVVKELAGDALAYLCASAGSADVAGIVPLSGRSAVSTDPDTGNVMCWVLVRVDLLATTITS